MKQTPITIAIDGYSSCGKSTLARDLATHLQYIHIDSGAMYRAVTWYFSKHDLLPPPQDNLQPILNKINISFQSDDGEYILYLNGRPLIDELRLNTVNDWVSQVAAISAIRAHLVDQQRSLGDDGGIVMDGRDIGTVVFPEADIKFFLVADFDVRVDRRWKELKDRNIDISRDEVAANLKSRDKIDSTREDSPLRKADDSITLDTTSLTRTDQLNKALEYCQKVTELELD